MFMGSFSDEGFAVADERGLHDGGCERLVAHTHAYRVAGCGAERKARERNGTGEGRRERAAGDFSFATSIGCLLVSAQHTSRLREDEAEEFASLSVRTKRRLADEVARALQVDGPREACV